MENNILITDELVDKISQNICRAILAIEGSEGHSEEKIAGKIEELNKFFMEQWNSTDDDDVREKAHFRSVALAALHTLGYPVTIDNPLVRAVLV